MRTELLPGELGYNYLEANPTDLRNKLTMIRAMLEDKPFAAKHEEKLRLLEKILLAKIEANTH